VLVVAYPWLGALLAVFAGGAGGMEVFELIFTTLVSVLLLSAVKRAFGRRIPGSVTIAGYGESNARVAAFLRRLDDSVGAPELRQVIRSNRGDKQVSEFLLGVAR
jgi:hypothetical protein